VFSNLHWTPKPIDPVDQNLNGIPMAQVDEAERQKVYDQMKDAANELLKELDVNTAIRDALMLFYVEGQIKKLLAL
jgi:hypothetical protein